MSAADDAKAKEFVLATLKDAAIGEVNFTLGPVVVTPSLYAKVAEAISGGKITVMVQPNLFRSDGASAHYVNRLPIGDDTEFYDLLLFRSAELRVGHKPLVVHECTHAGFDVLKLSMTSLENEAAAYVAEVMYAFAKLPAGTKPGRYPGTSPIHAAAWDMGAHFQVKPHSRGPEWWIAFIPKWHALLVSIMSNPEYGQESIKTQMNFDGVGREWKLPPRR